jgi:outer membrane protein assembly factor BamB
MDTRFPEQPRTPETPDFSQQRAERSRGARITKGGTVLVILLLAGIVAATRFLNATPPSAQASGGAPTPTPTVTIATPAPGQPRPQGSLYIAAPDSLTRIDLKTHNVLWTTQANYPLAPLVMGKTLFFNDQGSTSPTLDAASVKTGRVSWSNQAYPNGFLLGSRNMLYDSTCVFSADISCHVYGINASTGAQIWSYDLTHGSTWIALQDGVLYGVSYTAYFALNATTGVPLWQKDLLSYTDQEAIMNPVVRGNVLSFASCNATKQSSGFPGCYLYAFNASTGQELWHTTIAGTGSIQVTPTIMDGVVYAATNDGTLYAFRERNGEQLWSANVDGGSIGQLLSNAGTIYVETIGSDGQTPHVEAFDATTHAPRWGQISATTQILTVMIPLIWHKSSSGGLASHPFVLDHRLIYIQSGSFIVVLDAKDGSQVTQYPVPGGTLSGFTVVGQ